MEFKFRNVNDAFRGLVWAFHQGYDGSGERLVVREESRNGPVLRIPGPVTITYTRPRERVLFNRARDANPFFHLFESLWMLAGRNDLAPVQYYVDRMKTFSDDGKTLNGAYGHRWRHASVLRSEMLSEGGGERVGAGLARGRMPEVDQLNMIVDHLRANPTSRRVVLQMWNVEDDLLKVGVQCSCGTGLNMTSECRRCNGVGRLPSSKDVCCNLSVMFSLRPTDWFFDAEHVKTEGSVATMRPPKSYALDMTVTNRSNDLVWGLLGANYVQFSILQEYMAARLGAEVGLYHHFTNNLHAYAYDHWFPEKWLVDNTPDWYKSGLTGSLPAARPFPLVEDAVTFDREVKEFVDSNWDTRPESTREIPARNWEDRFLATVAQPMMAAYHAYVRHESDPLLHARQIAASDWRAAAMDWLKRRPWKEGTAPVYQDGHGFGHGDTGEVAGNG